MPYRSLAQQRYFHAHKAELERQGVNVGEWDEATGDRRLPERLGKTRQEKSKDRLKVAMNKHASNKS